MSFDLLTCTFGFTYMCISVVVSLRMVTETTMRYFPCRYIMSLFARSSCMHVYVPTTTTLHHLHLSHSTKWSKMVQVSISPMLGCPSVPAWATFYLSNFKLHTPATKEDKLFSNDNSPCCLRKRAKREHATRN